MSVTLDRFKKAFGGNVGDDLLAERQGKVRKALKDLKAAVDTLEAVGAPAVPHKNTLLALAVRFNNLNKMPVGNDAIYADLDAVKDEARTAADLAKRAALAAPQTQAGAGKLLAQFKCEGAKPAAVRKAIEEARRTDPDFMKKVAALPGGSAVIDAAMEDLGANAKSAAAKDFATAAIVARFQMESLDGDLSAKSLPQLYKVLGMVPEAHARNNPKLAKIVLKAADGGGDYTGGKVVLNCGRPDHMDLDEQFKVDDADGMDPAWRAEGDDHSHFDSTTLHELGHAVDDQMKFMDGRTDVAAFGGWARTSLEKVADEAGASLGFYGDLSDTFPQAMLRKSLMAALNRTSDSGFWADEKKLSESTPTREELLGDVSLIYAEEERRKVVGELVPSAAAKITSDAKLKIKLKGPANRKTIERVLIAMLANPTVPVAQAVDAVLRDLGATVAPPSPDDWAKKIVAHRAFQWCLNCKVADQWKLGNGGATPRRIGGNVYTYDKSGWYHYAFSARKKSMSTYQFNSPAEWFAELYAAYYLKKLKPAHPDYKWMHEQVHPYSGA